MAKTFFTKTPSDSRLKQRSTLFVRFKEPALRTGTFKADPSATLVSWLPNKAATSRTSRRARQSALLERVWTLPCGWRGVETEQRRGKRRDRPLIVTAARRAWEGSASKYGRNLSKAPQACAGCESAAVLRVYVRVNGRAGFLSLSTSSPPPLPTYLCCLLAPDITHKIAGFN